MKVIILPLFVSIIFSSASFAGGLLDSIEKDLKMIGKSSDKSIQDAVANVASEVKRIDREAYLIATREQAISERLAKLERVVAEQKSIINIYETLVVSLEARIAELENEQ